MKCKVCGNNLGGGCVPVGVELCSSRYYFWLSKEDWKNIYNFMRTVYLPFMHSIFANAEERKKALR